MPRLFECCHKCKPPKRSPTCHGSCPEYLADRARLNELNVEDRKDRRNWQYTIDLVVSRTNSKAVHDKNSPKRRRADRS